MSRGKKAILISIKPEWVDKILKGKKTIEIRKSIPKCDLPIDVYIYCSKGDVNLYKVIRKTYLDLLGTGLEPFDEQMGFSLTKEKLAKKYRDNLDDGFSDIFTNLLNGRIVAKFTLNKVSDILKKYKYISNGKTYVNYISNCGEINWCQKACLSSLELENYLSLKNGYAWHIDNLQIFNKPMELTDFYKNNWEYLSEQYCEDHNCHFAHENSVLGDDGYCPINECPRLRVNKPPQSWQYVFVGDEDEKKTKKENYIL